jgi:hypothetical protein
MIKEGRDKIIGALSSTLSADDMKHIKVDGNLIQFVPKGPKFSVDKIPLKDPNFQESDEWKTMLDSIQYFLNKVMDEKRQQREENGLDKAQEVSPKEDATSEKPKRQRKRRSKKAAADQQDTSKGDDDHQVPQDQGEPSGNKKSVKKRVKKPAAENSQQDAVVEPQPEKPAPKSASRRKRSNKKSDVPDPAEEMDQTAASRSVTESSSRENTTAAVVENKSNSSPAKTGKRSMKNNLQEEPKTDKAAVANQKDQVVPDETPVEGGPKRKPKRALKKVDPDRKAQILESDVFDYSELEDVLTAPSLPKRGNTPFFAPGKGVSTGDRIANKNKPSHKSKLEFTRFYFFFISR